MKTTIGFFADEEIPRARVAALLQHFAKLEDDREAWRVYISSAPLDIERLAAGARGHWGVESMHWLLDVEFKDDLSRYRAGHGAKNMAVVRRFALGLVRAHKSKGSVKTRRKAASWNTDYLLQILQMK